MDESYDVLSYVEADEPLSAGDDQSYDDVSDDPVDEDPVDVGSVFSRSRLRATRVSPTRPARFRLASCSSGGTGWNAKLSRFAFFPFVFFADAVPTVGA